MTIERASPSDLRKALEVAQLLAKNGIDFVPVPVADSESKAHLVEISAVALAAMGAKAEPQE